MIKISAESFYEDLSDVIEEIDEQPHSHKINPLKAIILSGLVSLPIGLINKNSIFQKLKKLSLLKRI